MRTLRDKVQSMLYERTAISRRPALLAKEDLDRLRDQDQTTCCFSIAASVGSLRSS